MKKLFIILILEYWLFLSIGWSNLSAFAAVIFSYHLLQLILNSGESIALREFIMILFSINYLMTPAIMYNGLDEYQFYKMAISEAEYFNLAIPSILLLHLGIFFFKTTVFQTEVGIIKHNAELNEGILRQWVIAGVALRIIAFFVPGEITFFLYLLSGIRFIAVFSLFSINFKKNVLYIILVFVLELSLSLKEGLFHDLVLWIVFFCLFASYLLKPRLAIKILIVALGLGSIFILQLTKGDYRNKTFSGEEEAGFETFSTSVQSSAGSSDLLSKETIATSLTRINQAWIFASTVRNLNKYQDFQGLKLIGIYAEAALLPRFLAPNKLTSGNRDLFNKYSGRFIAEGTSMGLGILADGYISYGRTGVYVFAFGLGLIFCSVFKIVEKWTTISPFFVLFIFPILHYPIRPDCETQTVLGHIVKSLIVFSVLAKYYESHFKRLTVNLQ